MSAYIYANVEVIDPELYETYRRNIPAAITAYGGRFLVRGGATTILEGSGVPKRQVILEFPNVAHLQAFDASAEYQRPITILQRASTGTLFGIESVIDTTKMLQLRSSCDCCDTAPLRAFKPAGDGKAA